MLEPVSVALKFGFLAVLYLFLLWVALSALRDLRRPAEFDEGPVAESSPPAEGFADHALVFDERDSARRGRFEAGHAGDEDFVVAQKLGAQQTRDVAGRGATR